MTLGGSNKLADIRWVSVVPIEVGGLINVLLNVSVSETVAVVWRMREGGGGGTPRVLCACMHSYSTASKTYAYGNLSLVLENP